MMNNKFVKTVKDKKITEEELNHIAGWLQVNYELLIENLIDSKYFKNEQEIQELIESRKIMNILTGDEQREYVILYKLLLELNYFRSRHHLDYFIRDMRNNINKIRIK